MQQKNKDIDINYLYCGVSLYVSVQSVKLSRHAAVSLLNMFQQTNVCLYAFNVYHGWQSYANVFTSWLLKNSLLNWSSVISVMDYKVSQGGGLETTEAVEIMKEVYVVMKGCGKVAEIRTQARV